jgi:hypothetical protein
MVPQTQEMRSFWQKNRSVVNKGVRDRSVNDRGILTLFRAQHLHVRA